jgi:uncharacterized membrane protein
VTNDFSARRRWFGALCLLAAITLLVVDEYVIRDRIGDLLKLAYWLVCLVFTMLAIVAAFLDIRALRRSTRDQQRALFENTLQKVSREDSGKPGDSGQSPP